MNWDTLRRLLERLFDEAPWIAALEQSADGKRLAVCIALDVLSEALEVQDFVSIFGEISDYGDDIQRRFGEIVNDEEESNPFLCRSRLNSRSPADGDTYVRILMLDDYLEYYADRYIPTARGRERFRQRCRVNGEEGEELRGVRGIWRGKLANVWITSQKAFNELLANASGPKGMTAFDALGLSWDWSKGNPELIAVEYPLPFDSVCAQPTTFDAWWKHGGHYYLSYGRDDGWGRTASLTGSFQPQPERVHMFVKKLGPGYRLRYIAEVGQPVQRSTDLMSMAYGRIASALRSGSTEES